MRIFLEDIPMNDSLFKTAWNGQDNQFGGFGTLSLYQKLQRSGSFLYERSG